MARWAIALVLSVGVAGPSVAADGPATPARVQGQVVDGQTGQPVEQALVRAGPVWVSADSAGRFAIEVDAAATGLAVSAMGYRAVRLDLPAPGPLEVRLAPRALHLTDAVVVDAAATVDKTAVRDRRRTSTTAALAGVPGVDLVRRGGFGEEPTVRGQQGGRVAVRIDGMHMAPACVDGMDPVTAYVEIANLERLEVSKGAFDLTAGSGLAGTVDLVTRGAEPGRAAGWSLESAYASASTHRTVRAVAHGGVGATAARTSVSLQRAGHLRPGGGVPRLTNSGFSKVNAKLDVARRLDERHRLDLGLLVDRASDMGYPVLLMDARRAHSLLASATHTWSLPGGQLRSRLYHSRVDHWMDDDERDVSQREVMPDMHMPMFGRTRTWGLRQQLEAVRGGRDLSLVLDAYHTAAFADMWMYSTLPDVSPMYLQNLGDVRRWQASLAAAAHQPVPGGLDLRVDLRVDAAASDLDDDLGHRQVEASVPASALARRDALLSAGAVLSREAAGTGLHLAVARAARRPSDIERYGFFLYDIGQGAFVQGDPRLDPERALQVEFGVEHRAETFGVSLSLHHQRIDDYIAAVGDEFRTYANLGAAEISGVEATARWRYRPQVEATATTAWTRGHSLSLDEPLPAIPPWQGSAGLAWTGTRARLSAATRWAAAQDRVAARSSVEDETAGWVALDLGGEWRSDTGWTLVAGIDNLLDRRYHEHLSVGNLPAPGRNLHATLRIDR